jgi:NADPH2:quinone reductase
MRAITCNTRGGPEVMKFTEVAIPKIGKNDVRIKQSSIGVNFIDTMHRQGKYKTTTPLLGVEGIGRIEEIGSEVQGWDIGDRVGYATCATPRSYSEVAVIDAKYIVRIPNGIHEDVAAALLLKGLTAHYLLHRVAVIGKGVGILVHAAAGGVGQVMGQWARATGALVLGTVGSDAKKQIALDSGYHRVYNYNTEDWLGEVKKDTKDWGVNVVYDSIGQKTFDNSLNAAMLGGMVVLFGTASGMPEPVALEKLREKSLFLTCPTLFDYKSNRNELVLSAAELFANITDGTIKPNIYKKYPLKDAAVAHQDLESGKTTGSIILIP